MTILELDIAGEWRYDSKEWTEMCKRVGTIIRYGWTGFKKLQVKSTHTSAVKTITARQNFGAWCGHCADGSRAKAKVRFWDMQFGNVLAAYHPQ